MGGMSSISSMIAKWKNLIDSDCSWSVFFSSFLSLFFLNKRTLSFAFRLVIHAYCKVEVKIVLKLQAQ